MQGAIQDGMYLTLGPDTHSPGFNRLFAHTASCTQGKWSKEEDEQLRQLVGEKGPKWKEISTSLGRFPEGCRDRWRELKLGGSRQSGRWSEEETAKLRSLVNEYLARKQVCNSHIALCLSSLVPAACTA